MLCCMLDTVSLQAAGTCCWLSVRFVDCQCGIAIEDCLGIVVDSILLAQHDVVDGTVSYQVL